MLLSPESKELEDRLDDDEELETGDELDEHSDDELVDDDELLMISDYVKFPAGCKGRKCPKVVLLGPEPAAEAGETAILYILPR